MSTLSQFMGGIKSIQRGVINIPGGLTSRTGTATIAAVNTSKTELRFLGSEVQINYANQVGTIRIALTNATTITAERTDLDNTAANVSWELTEYH